MDIKELESFKLSDAVKFHDKLNPALWTEKGELDSEVKKQLMIIAKDFMSELGLSSLKVDDITISGSNAAYSYTPHSDLDLHILVDFSKLSDDEVYRELFNAKKTLYNDAHDIKVHGVPIELYVQDTNQPHASLGEYSLLKNEWNKFPVKRRANFDHAATKLKYEKLGELIELAIKTKSLVRIEKVLDIIKRYRKAGLEKTGEFGPENLAFKALRKQGYIQKLYNLKKELHSKELSIEDYHPNAKPPGPEFPPEMPQGTVKVDVSDVYDWYKLGQHISDLEGLGKHDFGQGPPQTVISFGDEDLEHMYLKNLEKLGLKTHDIDPGTHPGMKKEPQYGYKVDEAKQKVIEGTNCLNCVWWKKDSEKPVSKDELNSNGGLKPPNKEYIAMSKRVDLVTLPGKDTVKVKGFCYHKDINDWVTERMCCAKWDAKGVIRDYKGESPLMETKLDEVLDTKTAADLEWRKDNFLSGHSNNMYTAYTATAKDKNDNTLKYSFFNFSKHDLTAIEFTRAVGPWGDNYKIDKAGDQYTVFATLIEAIKQYLQKHDSKFIMFGAKESSRSKLYQAFVNRFARQFGYKQIDPDNIPNTVKSIILSSGDTPFLLQKVGSKTVQEVSGYIPSEKEKNDPRFKTALTVDVKPDSIKKNAKAFGFNVTRAGIPPLLRK